MRSNVFKTLLLTSVCALGLSACETMDSAWNGMTGDETPYAGDVQPQQTMQPMPQQAMAQPMQMQQPQMMQPVMQPMMAQQPVIPQPPAYQPNLASVPARPDMNQLPQPQVVQDTRSQLSQQNQMVTGVLRDPRAPQYSAAPQAIPLSSAPQAPMMAAQQPQPMMQPAMQPQMMQPMQQAMAPVAAPQTDSKLMGLQPTATGQFALVPLAPEAPLGGFSMASSLAYGPGTNQLNMQQYQELQRLAAQYKMQPGRVRVVSYGNEQDPQILGRATSTAAYLVDMGVPANAIRLKIEATAPVGPQNKTDIFLETMPAR